jgi:hypothetical protein
MALYGYTIYGTDTYGYDIPPAYRVDPFIAVPVDYNSIRISWTAPAGTILAYRLVKNSFGFPTDQDDGQILIDSTAFPGSQFVDTNVVPGAYHYYGFYVLLSFLGNNWVRSGVTACLMPTNFQSGLAIHQLIPAFYHLQSTSGILDANVDDFPSEVLDFFCNVLGWGVDYLKTQYDTYLNVNNPWTIPFNDLLNLATELGININPDIHPYTLRKAIYYNATVNKQRGTTSGLVQELDILTGYSADLQIAQNFMLENDQSAFLDPVYLPWSANIAYNLNESVSYGNYWYKCISTGNIGHAPTGTSSSNTWWQAILSVDDHTVLLNSITNNINTWELLVPSASNGAPVSTSLYEILGISNPLNATSFAYNGLDCYNKSGSTTNILIRSVSRIPADITTNGPNFPPNKDQGVRDGTPVPFVNNSLTWNGTTWNATTRYSTGQIVTYNNVPFIALRASTNVLPPFTSRASVNNEWAPVSLEPRFRICISAYLQASTTGITATPFAEWYDANGNFITRVTARNTTPGVVGAPPGLVSDSFTYVVGNTLALGAGRRTDDGQLLWTQQVGTFKISPFSDGCVYPLVTSQRTYATVSSGVSNCQVGITFVTATSPANVQGLVLRWQDDNNYLRATMSEIDLKQAGVFTTLGTYSSAANVGDRLIVQLNGSTITAFINGAQVLQVTSGFNTSGTNHGIISEGAIVVINPGSQSNTVGQQV